MDVVVFIGLQASGKSTFFQQRFADTHVRINLDMLRTRNRERRLIDTCIDIGQPFVVDNTNVSKSDRQRYFELANANGLGVCGYYFQSEIEACKSRNEARAEDRKVPTVGLLGAYARLEVPSLDEGFNQLFYVKHDGLGGFVVEEWQA